MTPNPSFFFSGGQSVSAAMSFYLMKDRTQGAGGQLFEDEEVMAQMNPPLPDKGTGAIHDGSTLHETVQAGKLPNRRPDHMWAGRSDGGDCAICAAPVEREEMEYELEYVRNGPDPGVDTHRVHIRCFTSRIWTVQESGVRRS